MNAVAFLSNGLLATAAGKVVAIWDINACAMKETLNHEGTVSVTNHGHAHGDLKMSHVYDLGECLTLHWRWLPTSKLWQRSKSYYLGFVTTQQGTGALPGWLGTVLLPAPTACPN